jgi:hypothetical protein
MSDIRDKGKIFVNWRDRSPSFKMAWQSTIVLTFLTLFWTLAFISPYTNKSAWQYFVVGEIILVFFLGLSAILTFKGNATRNINLRRIIIDHPQIWVVLLYVILSTPDLTIIPMCDSGAYFKSVLDAVRGFNFVPGASLKAMILFGHPAFGYAAYLMLGQFISFANFWVANLQARILAAAVILAFAGIVDALFAGKLGKLERLLITGLFAFNPLVYGLSMTVSVDFAVLVFLCLTFYFYLHNKTILVLASGIMLCFSKEAGALLYGSFVIVLFAVFLHYSATRENSRFNGRLYINSLIKNSYLIVPVLLFGIYLLTIGQMWIFSSPQDLLQSQSRFVLDRTVIFDKTVQIFLANFNWIIWGLIAAGYFAGLFWRMRLASQMGQSGEQNIWLVVLAITLLPFLAINYVFKTWDNARYIVPVIFFELIFLIKALEVSRLIYPLRLGVLAISFVLFFVGCFRTIDPVLIHLFPTFMFGDHRMSFYNSQFTLCDLTLYNREYTYYNRLFDQFLQESKFNPEKDAFVFMTDNYLISHNVSYNWTGTDWTGNLYVDPRTLTRTYNPNGNILLKAQVYQGDIDVSSLPEHAFTIRIFWRKSLGNMADALIRQYYEEVREIKVMQDGYSLDGYELVLKK